MVAEIGALALLIALGLAVYASAASALGARLARPRWVDSASRAARLTFPLLTIAVAALVYSLVSLDFRLAYVADVSSRTMSPFLRVTALWGGQQGSVLFWAWIMSGFIAAVSLRDRDDTRDLMPYVLAVSSLTLAFFIAVVVVFTNPFDRLWMTAGSTTLTRAVWQPVLSSPYFPQDGQGLNPLLRHFGMISHPPTTYLGFTGFVVPYAFAMAALLANRAQDDAWIQAARRWTLVAWVFLSLGLVLGGRWAYDVLGWGGFWGWDPVENAMLMPWLTGTAFLHSVQVTERRGMLKVWNMVLIILTYSLSLFGTFITRTGVVGSVHAFAKSALGPAFLLFIGLTFLLSIGILFRRLPSLKAEHELEGTISRESAFVLQNVLFLAITFAVFWGTVFPLISELVTGTKITVGPPYFRRVTGPLFFLLVLLMGAAPLLAWRRQGLKALTRALAAPLVLSLILSAAWSYGHRLHPASWASLWLVSFVALTVVAEFVRGVAARRRAQQESLLVALARLIGRNRRRYGGYIVHLGVLMIALAFVGDSFFKIETQGTVGVGEQLSLGPYRLRFEGLRGYPGSDGRDIVEANSSLFREDVFLTALQPRRDFFVVQEQPVTVPAVYSTPGEDVYILLAGWDPTPPYRATFKIYLNPLIGWAWWGAAALVLGILVAVWPDREREDAPSYRMTPARRGALAAAGD